MQTRPKGQYAIAKAEETADVQPRKDFVKTIWLASFSEHSTEPCEEGTNRPTRYDRGCTLVDSSDLGAIYRGSLVGQKGTVGLKGMLAVRTNPTCLRPRCTRLACGRSSLRCQAESPSADKEVGSRQDKQFHRRISDNGGCRRGYEFGNDLFILSWSKIANP